MIDGLETGRTATVEELWTEFSIPLRAYLATRTRNGADADDLLQDVFLRIHSNLSKLHRPEKLQGWVYRIARNALVDYYRGRRDLEDLREVPAPDASSNKDAVDLTPTLRRFVAQLPPMYREPLERYEFRGMELKEVAKDLGLSLTAAKSRVQRARSLLRAMLIECCKFEFDRRGRVIEATARQRCDCSGCES